MWTAPVPVVPGLFHCRISRLCSLQLALLTQNLLSEHDLLGDRAHELGIQLNVLVLFVHLHCLLGRAYQCVRAAFDSVAYSKKMSLAVQSPHTTIGVVGQKT